MIPNGMRIGTVHTYQDLHMIPKSKITFSPPSPKFEFEALTGANGDLDHTEFLTDRVVYENRTGAIVFLVLTGDQYQEKYNQCKNVFNGTVQNIILDDDPDFTYKGRMWVSAWRSWEGRSEIAIEYDLEPYRYSGINISSMDWLFDEVIENNLDIYYGSFQSIDAIARTLINPTNTDIKPTFTTTSPMDVSIDGVVYRLAQGVTTNPGFVLSPGENHMTFIGTGIVSMDYDLGKQL